MNEEQQKNHCLLAREHPGNRNAYSNAKGSFVAGALRRAGIEPPPRDLLPE